MPNTYTQIHLQFVFAVRNRRAMIDKSWKDELHKYITGIFQNQGHKMLQINSMPDHIHILVGFKPKYGISEVVQKVKSESTKWINDKGFCKSKFAWQEGFGAFSYSKSHLNTVIKYIQNQEKHHTKKTFLEEYQEFLESFEVDYRQEFIFKELE